MTTSEHQRFWLIGLGIFAILVWLLRDMLAPFLAGMAVAYLLDPVCDRLERLRLPRWLATTVVLVAFFAAVVAAFVVLIPVLRGQLLDFVDTVPHYREELQEVLAPLYERLRETLSEEDVEQLRGAIGQYAGDAIGWVASLAGGLWRGGMAVIDVMALLVITPVVAFYLLRDWDRMIARIDSYLPRPSAATLRQLANEVDETLAGFIRGQGTVCLILGTFYALALAAVGLDFGVLVGLGAGLISFIPYVGSMTGFIVAVGIALVQFDDWTRWLMVAAIFIGGQAVEGNFLTPRLVGGSVGLHPVWVMFALLAGGSLLGFTGVLIAVPAAAVIGVLVRFAVRRYLDSIYYRGGARTRSEPEARAAEPEPPEAS
ncbi:MAG: AI-2E family transporter [Azospirillaceae bacterium]